MKKYVFLLLTIGLFNNVFSQKNGSIKGVALDKAENKPVSNATVTLLQKKDSMLVSFSMTDKTGKFEFTAIPHGDYRLLVTHVNYHSSHKYFTIDDAHKTNEVNIEMTDKTKVLTEVEIKSEAPPVTLIDDTVQYNAGSFKTLPHASVEDLLKKLPGVKVQKDGTIKAQGEKVQKVLVDGKEFFGNGPKVATKNLPADAIDKVQVYDKLSDQAQLTGFDDGNSEKTINLKLKKDKKKGNFGKVNVGGGSDERYQGKFNVNSFKGARQMSAIGMGNNTNAEGFSFMDILSFTGALSQMQKGNGNVNIQITDDDPIAGLLGNNNTGINTTFAGGFNYNNILGNKTDLQSNYFYSHYNPNKQSNIQRQYFLPDSSYFYNQNSFSNNINNTHRINLNAEYQADSFNSFKITPSLGYQQKQNSTSSAYNTLSQQLIKNNEGISDNLSDNSGYSFSNNILYKHKSHRKGRTFSVNLFTNLNNSTGNGELAALTSFYDKAGMVINSDSINQVNNNSSYLKAYNIKAVYTEPIFKHSLIELSAGQSNNKNKAEKATYEYNSNSGRFDKINPIFTNNFENTYSYTNGGLRFRNQTKKYSYSAGLSWQHAELLGLNKSLKDSVLSKTFYNFLPSARFQYSFTKFKNVTLNYNTSTNQPSVSQLQPVPDNSNPLNIKQGNPNLKQEFIHALRLNIAFVNPFRNRNFFAFVTLQQTNNKIVNYDKINSLGIDTTNYININGVFNMNGTLSWGFPIHFLKGSIDISTNTTMYKGQQFINAISNNIRTLTAGPEVRLDMNPTDKLNMSLTAGLDYYSTKYSLPSARNTNYFRQNYGTEIAWQLPKGYLFSTDFNYSINTQYAQGFNAKVQFWNASLSKQVLHFNRGEIKLSANDLLNQNVG
ncbi:MAG: outer membrane beta-barrel protein, partial [Ginsengibacter sp.]